MSSTLTVAFWNRDNWHSRDRQERQISFLKDLRVGEPLVPWDVLILAEVPWEATRDFASRLPSREVHASLDAVTDRSRPHGIAMLARNGWSLDDPQPILGGGPLDDPRSGRAVAPPRPERSLAARLGDTGVTVVGWHAPHAQPADGRDKVDAELHKQRAYREMTQWLQNHERPLIIGLDGNNWGEPETGIPTSPDTRFFEEGRFHDDPSSTGLVDTLRARHPDRVAALVPHGPPLAVTKVVPTGHRMDRIYVSPDIEVLDAGVSYDSASFEDLDDARRPTAGSDHALVWATLRLP